MNTVNAMTTTTCKGTPSCCRSRSSYDRDETPVRDDTPVRTLRTSESAIELSSSESLRVRLRTSVGGADSGALGALASSARNRSISRSASWYFAAYSNVSLEGSSLGAGATAATTCGAGADGSAGN